MMRIYVMCESPLMQKSLEIFLERYLSTLKNCDFVVSDKKVELNKPVCLISQDADADIKKPFTKAQLILGLERFFKDPKIKEHSKTQEISNGELEKKIEFLTHQFVKNLLEIIKEHYGK